MIWQYTLQKNRNKEPTAIMLRNKTVPSKERTQFCGMTLDSRLNWEEYINDWIVKTKRVLTL